MLTFWALLDEAAIDAYIGTLILPDYMSYLRRCPIALDRQAPNTDGRRPLVATYQGDGRIEEYELYPEYHAVDLLRTVCPALPPGAVRLDAEGSIWNWSPAFTNRMPESADRPPRRPSMRVYFDPVTEKLPADARRFEPESCFASVSRKELFLGRDVLRAYFCCWIQWLEGAVVSDRACSGPEPETEIIAGGLAFHGECFGGQFILQDDAVFRDLLRFASLDRVLADIADLVRLDLENAETEIDDDGLRFRLVPTVADVHRPR